MDENVDAGRRACGLRRDPKRNVLARRRERSHQPSASSCFLPACPERTRDDLTSVLLAQTPNLSDEVRILPSIEYGGFPGTPKTMPYEQWEKLSVRSNPHRLCPKSPFVSYLADFVSGPRQAHLPLRQVRTGRLAARCWGESSTAARFPARATASPPREEPLPRRNWAAQRIGRRTGQSTAAGW